MKINGYEILKVLKRHSKYGRVFLAQKSDLKVILKEFDFSKGGYLPFKRENYVNLPGVPALKDFFVKGNKGFVAREFVKSKDLQLLAENKFFLTKKRRICFFLHKFLQFLDVLQLIHNQRIIHNDIRPSNILSETESGKIFLIDFALAKIPGFDPQVPFSLIFSPPERIFHYHDMVDESSDIYMAGITLWTLLEGHYPYEADNPEFLINIQLNLPVPEGKMPEELLKIIRKATFKRPLPLPPNKMGREAVRKHIFEDKLNRFTSVNNFKQQILLFRNGYCD